MMLMEQNERRDEKDSRREERRDRKEYERARREQRKEEVFWQRREQHMHAMMINQMMCMTMIFSKGDEIMKGNSFQLPNPYATAKAPTEERDTSVDDEKSTSSSDDE
jgi:hypothetical protein